MSQNNQTSFSSTSGGARQRSAGFSLGLRLLLLAIALIALTGTVAELIVHSRPQPAAGASFDAGHEHARRLQVSTARAAMDVLGIAGSSPAPYRLDYRVQRMQMQADSEGLERWAANDPSHQGLLLEIRASLAELERALDQAAGTPVAAGGGSGPAPLLPALNRAQRALSNYASDIRTPAPPPGFFNSPGRSLILLGLEFALVLWLLLWFRRA